MSLRKQQLNMQQQFQLSLEQQQQFQVQQAVTMAIVNALFELVSNIKK